MRGSSTNIRAMRLEGLWILGAYIMFTTDPCKLQKIYKLINDQGDNIIQHFSTGQICLT